MVPEYRKEFNRQFSNEKYELLLKILTEKCSEAPAFRISESPVFLPLSFKKKLEDVTGAIIRQIKSMSSEELAKAIPADSVVPGDTSHPEFLSIDFGICKDEKGEISPKLIELQAFPTLYAFKKLYEESLGEVYPFIQEIKNPISNEVYFSKLKNVIIGDENPENVILLEIFPENQKTRIDFWATEKMLGIKTVGLTEVQKSGRKLYYEKEGRKIPIHRIYNRVIFDELHRYKDLKLNFDFRDDLDVKWIAHPNWFFKVSKFILPKLAHDYIPKSYFLNDFPNGEKLDDFVLKPLFSFAGSGINLHPTQAQIDAIPDKENFIMQRKVQYEPLFEDIFGDKAKGEIRMLFLWEPDKEEPEWVFNLTRMTKADMVNVDFNKKDAIWIGSSISFFV